MIIAPMFASILFRKRRKGMAEPNHGWLIRHYRDAVRKAIENRYITFECGPALSRRTLFTVGGPIGSEFLPHLDEGSIWVRGNIAT